LPLLSINLQVQIVEKKYQDVVGTKKNNCPNWAVATLHSLVYET